MTGPEVQVSIRFMIFNLNSNAFVGCKRMTIKIKITGEAPEVRSDKRKPS